jgi:hypothetical protein
MVVAVTELDQSGVKLIEIAKMANPEQLFLERSEETLDATIALRLPHEGG